MFPPAPDSDGGKDGSIGLFGATDNICVVEIYADVFLIDVVLLKCLISLCLRPKTNWQSDFYIMTWNSPWR